MATDNPLKTSSEVREGDSQGRSSSPQNKVMRELTGTFSTVPETAGAQWFKKTAEDVLRPKTPEKSEEQEIRKLSAREFREAKNLLMRIGQQLELRPGDRLILNEAVPSCIREFRQYVE